MTMNSAVEPGDVFEITTPDGSAYAQVTHKNLEYGFLIRVLPGLHRTRPDLKRLSQQAHEWVTFYPVDHSIKRGFVRTIGNYPIPSAARKLPLFRAAGLPDRAGRVEEWWLWDGKNEKRIGRLSDDQWDLPILEIVSHDVLVTRVRTKWRPREDKGQAGPQVVADAAAADAAGVTRHFLYFASEASARIAVRAARELGFSVDVGRPGDEWLVTATTTVFDVSEARAALEQVATRSGGRYDGWEASVPPGVTDSVKRSN